MLNINAGDRDSNPVTALCVKHGECETTLKGREAFALNALVERGAQGVTPLEWVGPRWSDYCLKLRRRGFDIETINERHGGAYAGRHGRYILRSPITVLEIRRQGDAGAAA